MNYPTPFQKRTLWNAATGVSILIHSLTQLNLQQKFVLLETFCGHVALLRHCTRHKHHVRLQALAKSHLIWLAPEATTLFPVGLDLQSGRCPLALTSALVLALSLLAVTNSRLN